MDYLEEGILNSSPSAPMRRIFGAERPPRVELAGQGNADERAKASRNLQERAGALLVLSRTFGNDVVSKKAGTSA
ncbi:hypothetical protein [Sphingobium herbicidovorans]|uniref:hypothetical protein n=1 Tax=Sphingobium herbicidovorans TaxID=76947 RepID=UPI0012E02195|nr:hypothetical protein [Sphingobium herbicidovorans]